MDADIKTRWVTALESGNYQQTTGSLARVRADGSIGYCCLGVLCMLAVEDGILDAPVAVTTTDIFTDDDRRKMEDGEVATPDEYVFEVTDPYSLNQKTHQGEVLPYVVMRWAGLNEVNPLAVDVNDVIGHNEEPDEYMVSVGMDGVTKIELGSYNDEMRADFNQIAAIIKGDDSL